MESLSEFIYVYIKHSIFLQKRKVNHDKKISTVTGTVWYATVPGPFLTVRKVRCVRYRTGTGTRIYLYFSKLYYYIFQYAIKQQLRYLTNFKTQLLLFQKISYLRKLLVWIKQKEKWSPHKHSVTVNFNFVIPVPQQIFFHKTSSRTVQTIT